MLPVPDFSVSKSDLLIVFAAALSFLTMVWAAKRLLFLLSISDFAMALQVKRDERRARIKANMYRISDSFLKTSMTQQEFQRRKELYKLKQERMKKHEEKLAERRKNVPKVSEIQNRLDKKNAQKYISKNNPKVRAANGRVISSKKVFMSEKYQRTVFKNPLKSKSKKRFHSNQKRFQSYSRSHGVSKKVLDPNTVKSFESVVDMKDTSQGYEARRLNQFSDYIKSHENVKSHFLLSGASHSFIVRTKNDEWYFSSKVYPNEAKGGYNGWKKLSDSEAYDMFDRHYFSSEYEKMKNA